MYVFMSLTMQHIACCLIWTRQAADLELRKNEIGNLKSVFQAILYEVYHIHHKMIVVNVF